MAQPWMYHLRISSIAEQNRGMLNIGKLEGCEGYAEQPKIPAGLSPFPCPHLSNETGVTS